MKKLDSHILDICIAGIVTLIVQAYWLFDRGIHAENYWILRSRNLGVFEGFIYSDPSRMFMSIPFQVSYLVFGEAYFGPHIVHLIYAIALSSLTYMVGKRLNLTRRFCFLAALISGTHGGDQSNILFSMVVVRQIVVVTLLVFLLTWPKKVDSETIERSYSPKNNVEQGLKKGTSLSPKTEILVFILSILGLFTYETIVVPLLLILLITRINRGKFSKGLSSAIFLWMIFTIFRYLVLDSESYQSKKFRLPNWEELQVSWINYFVHGFVPWTWDDLYIENLFKNCLDVMNSNIYGPLMITLLITLGGIAKIEFDARRLEKLSFLKKEYVGLLLFLMCLFSYLPYLFVSDGTGSWRTHFLAAPWNSLLVSFFLMKIYLRQFSRGYLNLFKIIAVFSGAAIFIFLGSVANLYQQLEYSVRWNDHRNFYGSLLQEVPGFLQGTSLLVTNVPDSIGLEKGFCPEARRDIFEDVYWLNANLEAYYPDKFDSVDYIKLADRDKFLRSYHEGDNSFIWQNHEYKLNQTIVVEFEQLGKTRIVNYPELVLALGKTSINYNPQSRILSGKSMLWTDFNLRFKHD